MTYDTYWHRVLGACALAGSLFFSASGSAATVAQVDPSLPDFTPHGQVSGDAEGVSGMDTVEGMMNAWARAFAHYHPGAHITIKQKDGMAPEDRIALGPNTAEAFDPTNLPYENKYGYEPFRIKICMGAFILKSHVSAIGVLVNKDNPLSEISLKKLDAVFSAERRRGYPADITTWGQLGLGGAWADKPIHIYGFYWRDDVTDYFRKLVMLDAPFKPDYRVPGGDMTRNTPVVAKAIMDAMAADPYGVTFANGSYMTDQVKALALSNRGVISQFAQPDIASGRYPLQRYLYIYVNREPGKPLSPLLKEFLRFVLSKQGQELVSADHYYPLPADVAAAERKKLN